MPIWPFRRRPREPEIELHEPVEINEDDLPGARRREPIGRHEDDLEIGLHEPLDIELRPKRPSFSERVRNLFNRRRTLEVELEPETEGGSEYRDTGGGGGLSKARPKTAHNLFVQAAGQLNPRESNFFRFETSDHEATLEKNVPEGKYVVHLRGINRDGNASFLLSLTKSGELQVHTRHPDHQALAEAVQKYFEDSGYAINIKHPKR